MKKKLLTSILTGILLVTAVASGYANDGSEKIGQKKQCNCYQQEYQKNMKPGHGEFNPEKWREHRAKMPKPKVFKEAAEITAEDLDYKDAIVINAPLTVKGDVDFTKKRNFFIFGENGSLLFTGKVTASHGRVVMMAKKPFMSIVKFENGMPKMEAAKTFVSRGSLIFTATTDGSVIEIETGNVHHPKRHHFNGHKNMPPKKIEENKN